MAAWLAVQAASIGFPAFDAPPWVLRIFILMMLLGRSQGACPFDTGANMDLQRWAQIAEVVSSVAVVISLIYVGAQVRQNTRTLMASTYNALTSNTVAILSPYTRGQEFAAFLHRAQTETDGLTPAERLRFHMLMQIAFRHWDNLYYQFRTARSTLKCGKATTAR